jgi:hypothetical protein
MMLGRKRLSIGAIELLRRSRSVSSPDRVRRYESLGLCWYRSEDAFLRESGTVLAAAILGCIKSRTADLSGWFGQSSGKWRDEKTLITITV